MEKGKWKRFFFESNQFFDYIASLEDWDRLRKAYPKLTDMELLDAKEATYAGTLSLAHREHHPNYGFRIEHDGERRLRHFFIANGMSLLPQPNNGPEHGPIFGCKPTWKHACGSSIWVNGIAIPGTTGYAFKDGQWHCVQCTQEQICYV